MQVAEMRVEETQRAKSKLLAILLVLVMAAVLYMALPAKAYALGDSTDGIIDLEDLTGDIMSHTPYWFYAQTGNTLAISSDVEIIGTVFGVSDGLTIIMDSYSYVTWKASYDATSTFDGELITLYGTGSFEVSSGSMSTYASDATTIYFDMGDTLYITGGLVNSVAGTAIETATGTDLVISDGTVVTETGVAVRCAASVNVSGGSVAAIGVGGKAIVASTVNLTGGTVSTFDGITIEAYRINAVSGSGGSAMVSNSGSTDPAILLKGLNNALRVSGMSLIVDGDVELTETTSSNIEVDSAGSLIVYGDITAAYDGVNAATGANVVVYGDIDAALNGVNATDPSTTVTVEGNINAIGGYGIVAEDDASVEAYGDITAGDVAVWATSGAKVNVGTDTVPISITAGTEGIHAEVSGTIVNLYGDIDAGINGIQAENGASVEATGEIMAVQDGISALGTGTTVTVVGDIDADLNGIETKNSATVKLTGNINAGMAGVYADSATAEVVGNITSAMNGIFATNSSIVNLEGDITVSGPSAEAGVFSMEGAEVTVDGTITAPQYIAFYVSGTGTYYVGDTDYDLASSKPGFLEYTGGDPLSWVWVRGTPTALPRAGDNAAIWALTIVSLLSLMGTVLVTMRRRVLY